jgi:hypothetical protein
MNNDESINRWRGGRRERGVDADDERSHVPRLAGFDAATGVAT